MTEHSQQWQPPGQPPPPGWSAPGGSAAPPPPPPGWAPAAAGWAPAAPGWGTPQGWTPPPKPGPIPLRPLGFGEILGAAFRVLRVNPRTTLGLSFLLIGVITVLQFGASYFATDWLLGRLLFFDVDDVESEAVFYGTLAMLFGGAVVLTLFSVVAVMVLQGILVREIAHEFLGERLRLGALLRRTRHRLPTLLGYALLYTLAMVLMLALGLTPLFGLAAGDLRSLPIIILVLLLAWAGFGVLGAWLFGKTSLVPSAIVLEELGIGAALRRSWRLTEGRFWRVFGAQFVVQLILAAISQVVTLPLTMISALFSTLLSPNGFGDPSIYLVTTVIVLMFTVVIAAISMVASSACAALCYVDARIRSEGLDLRLIEYIEQRQAGGAQAPQDPFLAGGLAARLG